MVVPVDETVLDVATLSKMKSFGVETFDARVSGVEGSVFLQDGWHVGTINISNDKSYDQYKFKYNVLDQDIVINSDGKFYSLPGMYVESFTLEPAVNLYNESSRKFIRKVDSDQKVYFVEVLAEGKYNLYKRFEIFRTKSTYNAVLDTGSLNEKLEQRQMYILAFEDELVEIPMKKRQFEKAFKEHREIMKFINSNDFEVSTESELVNFANELNTETN